MDGGVYTHTMAHVWRPEDSLGCGYKDSSHATMWVPEFERRLPSLAASKYRYPLSCPTAQEKPLLKKCLGLPLLPIWLEIVSNYSLKEEKIPKASCGSPIWPSCQSMPDELGYKAMGGDL